MELQMKNNRKTYSELIQLPTYEQRLDYLLLHGSVGSDTFGFDRYINQKFYRSTEWKRIRDEVIVRDNGCDLGIPDRPIIGKIYVHHMNPLRVEDIEESTENLLDPNNLICVSFDTHNIIHYGVGKSSRDILGPAQIERKKGDTCLWKQ